MSNDESKLDSADKENGTEDTDMNDAAPVKTEGSDDEKDKLSEDGDDAMNDDKTEDSIQKEEKDERTEEEKEAARKKYENWPLKDIKEPHENDVMYGRGGGTNHHPGNKRYRKMVEDRKLDYVNSKRLDKPLVALDIIRVWRAQEPPGRFLKLDEKTGLWHDVGDKKAREKTSQALREKAPLIRKQQEEEKLGKDGTDDDETGVSVLSMYCSKRLASYILRSIPKSYLENIFYRTKRKGDLKRKRLVLLRAPKLKAKMLRRQF